MLVNNNYSKIITDETLRETIEHENEEYLFRYYIEDIWEFDFHCIDWHWHPEIEFVFVEKGEAQFLIGNKQYTLSAGMGIFINTKIIHRFEASDSAIIPNIVFSPEVICSKESLVYKKYILPILHSSMNCCLFISTIAWQKYILDTLQKIFAVQKEKEMCEIKTIELLLQLWSTLYENAEIRKQNSLSEASMRAQAKLQIMMQYIHENYPFHISLADIAKTVFLSKSSVLDIFKMYLDTSPINYLISYRLKRAAKLLTTTENSIFSISQDTGFDNVSYFCRKFKTLYMLTPSEYRKINAIKNHYISST